MSTAEIERFAAGLKSNEALCAEAGKHAAERQHETPMACCVIFAASKGYVFTADDMAVYAKTRKLADAELVGVAGGVSGGELDPTDYYTRLKDAVIQINVTNSDH